MILKSPLQKTALIFCLGLLFYFWLSSPTFHLRPPPRFLKGRILEISPYPSGARLEVQTPLGRGFLYASFEPKNCLPGDLFQAHLRPSSQDYLNPFSMPRETYYRAKGIALVGRVRSPRDLTCSPPSRKNPLTAVRVRLFVFAERLSPTARGLFSALVLGEKGPLPEAFKERLKNQGLYHFLAVSGFHLGLFYGVLYALVRGLLKVFPLPGILPAQIPAAIAGFLGAGFYALLSGPSPSAKRALVMLGLFTLSKVFFWSTSGFDLLAGAVLLILLFSPASVLDLSFRLSVAAVLGILLAHGLYRRFALRLPRPLDYLAEGLTLSLGAALATLPFLLYTFGKAPLLSPVNTLLLSPLWCFVLIPGEILTALLVFLKEDWALRLAEFLGKILTVSFKVPWPEVNLVPPFPVGLFLFGLGFLGLTLYWAFHKQPRKALIAFILTAGFFTAGLYVRYRLFYLLVFDIGKGNAVLVHLPGNRNLLFDAGARYGRLDLGKRLLVSELHKLGITHLDLVVLSHPDLDHSGGLPALLQNFTVRRIISGRFRQKDWQKLGLSPPVEEIVRPQVLKGSSAEIFLFPGSPEPENANRESLLAYLEYKGLTVFFPGDADSRRLAREFRLGNVLPAEIFVLPHHGARNGYFAPFWKALRFRVAIASARGPRHPHPLVIQSLKHYHRPLYITAQKGALTVFLKGKSFLVCANKPLKKGLPFEVFWPYIPYLNEKGCREYGLHTLRNF